MQQQQPRAFPENKNKFIAKMKLYEKEREQDIKKISTPQELARRRIKALKTVLQVETAKLIHNQSTPIEYKQKANQSDSIDKNQHNFGIRNMMRANLPFLEKSPINILMNNQILEQSEKQSQDKQIMEIEEKVQPIKPVNIFGQGNQLADYKSKQKQVFNFTNNPQSLNNQVNIPGSKKNEESQNPPINIKNLFGFVEVPSKKIFSQGNPFYEQKQPISQQTEQKKDKKELFGEDVNIFMEKKDEPKSNIFGSANSLNNVNIFSQKPQENSLNKQAKHNNSSIFYQTKNSSNVNIFSQKPETSLFNTQKNSLFGQTKSSNNASIFDPKPEISLFNTQKNSLFGQTKSSNNVNLFDQKPQINLFNQQKKQRNSSIFSQKNEEKPSLFQKKFEPVNIFQAKKEEQVSEVSLTPHHTLSMAPEVGSDNDHIQQIQSQKQQQGDHQKINTDNIKSTQKAQIKQTQSQHGMNFQQPKKHNIFENQTPNNIFLEKSQQKVKVQKQQSQSKKIEQKPNLFTQNNIFFNNTSDNKSSLFSNTQPSIFGNKSPPSNIFASSTPLNMFSNNSHTNIFNSSASNVTVQPQTNLFSNQSLFSQDKNSQSIFTGLTSGGGNIFVKSSKQTIFQKKNDEEQQGDQEDGDDQVVQGQSEQIDPNLSTGKYENYTKTDVIFKQAALKFKRIADNADLIENITVSIEKIQGHQYSFVFIRLANKVIAYSANIVPNVTEAQVINNNARNVSVKKIVKLVEDKPNFESFRIQFKSEQNGKNFIQKLMQK